MLILSGTHLLCFTSGQVVDLAAGLSFEHRLRDIPDSYGRHRHWPRCFHFVVADSRYQITPHEHAKKAISAWSFRTRLFVRTPPRRVDSADL